MTSFYRWREWHPGFPMSIDANTHKELPRDIQFDSEKGIDFALNYSKAWVLCCSSWLCWLAQSQHFVLLFNYFILLLRPKKIWYSSSRAFKLHELNLRKLFILVWFKLLSLFNWAEVKVSNSLSINLFPKNFFKIYFFNILDWLCQHQSF